MAIPDLKDSLAGYRTIGEGVYEGLRGLIHQGELAPGFQLREVDVAKQFGVSRTPVREAIRKLESEGLLSYDSRRGLVVTQFTRRDLNDIYYIREALEGMAARLAAKRATAEDAAAMHQQIAAMEAAHANGDPTGFLESTRALNLLVCESSGNHRLTNLILELRVQIHQAQSTTFHEHEHRVRALEEYGRLLAAIEDSDGDAAEQIMRAHRRQVLEHRLKMQAVLTTQVDRGS